MPTGANLVADFKHAVAVEFASRPTLRQVAARKILEVLTARSTTIEVSQLPDAQTLNLLIPTDNSRLEQPYQSWTSRPIVDVMLEAMLSGKSLVTLASADGDFLVSAQPPHYLLDAQGNRLEYSAITIKHAVAELDDLSLMLPGYFCQALVEYWTAQGSLGVSRDCWLQQTIRMALLQNLPLQGLDAQQVQCVHALLKDEVGKPSVFIVQARLEHEGDASMLLLENLLLRAEWDEREIILWCAPCGVIKAFASLDAFATALRDELCERYRFDSMSWNRYELEGDAISQQCGMLLEIMLDRIDRLRYSQLPDIAALERTFSALGDPSQWFIEGYANVGDASLRLPLGLRAARGSDSFAYQRGLFDLALAQSQSAGAGALDDVLDLHSYTSQRLRAQMLADKPDEANYYPDDLELTLSIAKGVPGGAGFGTGDGAIEHRGMTLTEFAIGNLSALQGATLTGISHRQGQLIMDWMSVDYLKSLVQRVDIGAHYPAYVAQQLDDPNLRSERIKCFARQWRCSLLFSALSAKLARTLSEVGLQCVSDYCRGHVGTPDIVLMPLAFKREPGASQHDRVAGMYVLFCTLPSVVLLYRPLYARAPLTEFASLDAMMAAIRESGPLQDSILDWLAPQARPIYDNGGFLEPHLGQPIIDTTLMPEAVKPASFAAQFWRVDVDLYLYNANRDLLVELADRQSVSNAESRWAILSQGAWLLFDVVSLLLRGPVAAVAWLVQAITSLSSDVAALRNGSAFERSAAVVDLILNASMALLHARLPRLELPGHAQLPDASSFTGPLARDMAPRDSALQPAQGLVGLPGALAARSGAQLDFSWRGGQGFNALPAEQRKTLLALRSEVSLNGVQPLESGEARGLYRVAGRYYITLRADVYRVELANAGVRIVGRQGESGPWLTFEDGQWRIDRDLRLRGGMPKSRAELVRRENQRQFDALLQRHASLLGKRDPLSDEFEKLRDFMSLQQERVKKLKEQLPADAEPTKQLLEAQQVDHLVTMRVMGKLKELIDKDVQLDQILTDMSEPRFAAQPLTPAVESQRSIIRQGIIENCTIFHNHMAELINAQNVDALGDSVTVHPSSPLEVQRYTQYVELLTKIIMWQEQLMDISRIFDRLLEATLKDERIVFRESGTDAKANKEDLLGQIIRRRRVTAVDLRFRMLADYAELSLDRQADVDESVLEQYYDYLGGTGLRSAGSTHGELAASEATLTERIEILTGVLEAYEEAEALADYLSSVGGPAIKGEMLKRYKMTLADLKQLAVNELAQNVREQELEEIPPVRPNLYAKRSRRRLVRTHRGRSILAEESEVDGMAVVQQRDGRSNSVLKTFRQRGSEWVEDSVATPPDVSQQSPRDLRQTRQRAQALVEQIESVIKVAKRYVSTEEPLGLSSVIDGHVEKLQEASSLLLRLAPDESELIEGLSSGIQRLRNARRDLLTSLYLTTSHPTANSLRFLVEHQQVTLRRALLRRPLSSSDYLDVYEISRQSNGQAVGEGLWEAHFHYPAANTPAREFTKGHLKLWSQRKLGRQAQLRAAKTGQELLAIYRGGLRLADVEGIIPFD